jgi:hypothetical protein
MNNMASNVSSWSVYSRRSRRTWLMALTFVLGVAMGCQRLLSAMPLNILLLSHRVAGPHSVAPVRLHLRLRVAFAYVGQPFPNLRYALKGVPVL